MAIKVLVSHWLKHEWIAAFVLALAWFVSQSFKYIKIKQNHDNVVGGTTISHNTTAAPMHSHIDANTMATTTATTNNNTKRGITIENIGHTSSVLLAGFITLAAAAAFSGTIGYNSRSVMALCKTH